MDGPTAMTRYSCMAQLGSCWTRPPSTLCMLVDWPLDNMMECCMVCKPAGYTVLNKNFLDTQLSIHCRSSSSYVSSP